MNDLEDRTLKFAKDVREFCKRLKHDVITVIYIKQVIRSSSSIGANYIEANENLGKQDLILRLRIARKEAKETKYGLDLLESETVNSSVLKNEVEEIRKILSAIINKLLQKQKL
ncbi:MAG TPA: four helix bundle protein [Flavipsychrobacter sp.]|nr:four helix bundle protein [Flavipsychrobacter sp.]